MLNAVEKCHSQLKKKFEDEKIICQIVEIS